MSNISSIDGPATGAHFSAAPECRLGARGDVVVIGAGLAGLFTALKLAPIPVTVITAAPLGHGAASAWAQGGIAAAVGADDTPERHAADTIAVGAGLVDPEVARFVAAEGPDRVEDLVGYGVPFDRDAFGHFLLNQEAAHSRRRVVRVSGDRTGAAIMKALIAKVLATPSIRVLHGFEADELITADGRVEGVRLVRPGMQGASTYEFFPACAVILATGGLGKLYALTTNPEFARGEALAMAARVGAVIGDAEFVQFHPTAMDVGKDPAPLATEALRGDGATLVNAAGERFMLALDPRAELSPRDIVARGVFAEISAGRGAFLDCREAIGQRFEAQFPTVYAYCRDAGIDPAKQLIPVAPAAHYHMGGIATDGRGRTSVPGLWVVGEAASTGLHGGNRLASNSLLEATVFGARVASDIRGLDGNARRGPLIDLRQCDRVPRRIAPHRDDAIARLRKTMAAHVGVERSAEGLRKALGVLRDIEQAAAGDAVLSNMSLAGRFIAASALKREESRGAHARSDFPQADPALASRSFLTLADIDALSPAAAEEEVAHIHRAAGCR